MTEVHFWRDATASRSNLMYRDMWILWNNPAFLSVSKPECQHTRSDVIRLWQPADKELNQPKSTVLPMCFNGALTPAQQEMNIHPFVLAFIRRCCTCKWGCWPEGSGGKPTLSCSLPLPFVRAGLSPSPAVKGRIVAPAAASLVLMSPDANLTHGWSLNSHFFHRLFSALFLSLLFLVISFFSFHLSFLELMLYVLSPQFPRQLMRYN